jgi:hypothetical protein
MRSDGLVSARAASCIAFAGAFGAFDAEHVELAFDVAEDEIDAGHCEEKAPHRGGA